MDAQWRWTLLVFMLSFLLSWTAFGIVWWIIAHAHGDFDYIKTQNNINNVKNETFLPCVTEIYGFTSCFLFSVETQHTIGNYCLLNFFFN